MAMAVAVSMQWPMCVEKTNDLNQYEIIAMKKKKKRWRNEPGEKER